MQKGQHHIFKILLSALLCTTLFLNPSKVVAQDDDTTVVYSDSTAAENWEDDDYQNKAGKFSAEAVFRSVPDSTVARMQKEKEFAYANDPAYWVKEKKVYKKGFFDYLFEFFASDVVRVIFYVLMGALILFVLYRIIVANDLLIFHSSGRKKFDTGNLNVSEVDRSSIDHNIREAIDQKRFNIAVRYLYLKTLYLLNDKRHIEFHPEATNNEYLTQMSQHKKVGDFRFLTRVYEYVWYGKFDINEQQFAIVHSNFKNFQSSI